MKLCEISQLMPPNVASFVIGKFFARYVEVLLNDIGMASDIIGILVAAGDVDPFVRVQFDASLNRPTKPKISKMKALAKEMKLNGSHFSLDSADDFDNVFSVVLALETPIGGDIDEEALRKGFLSFDVKKFTGDIRLTFE